MATYLKKETAIAAVMRRVYFYIFIGLGISALMAYAFAYTPAMHDMLYNTSIEGGEYVKGFSFFGYVVLLSPLIILLFSKRCSMSATTSLALFLTIAALIGASLSSIFLVYTEGSIMMALLITGGMFFIMSLYGYATRKDLSSWGNILFMALIGIIIAMLVNLFIGSAMIDYIISIIAVVLFTCMISYDTKRIKQELGYAVNDEEINRISAWGALSLYLNFINLIMHILRLIGQKR